jgi:Zn-dependent alcohol dehydrogenase
MSGKLKLEGLISHSYGLDEINEAIDKLKRAEVVRVLIEMT